MTIDHRKLVTLTNYNSPYVEYITSKDGYQVTDTVTRYTKPVFLINNLFGDATLDLNFAADKSIGNLITFTRASSATYVGSDGLIKTAVADAPRFDHDPSTRASLGLLIEEERTNLMTYSEEFDQWNQYNGSSVIPNTDTAPDGTISADKAVFDGSDGGQITRDFSGLTVGLTYIISMYIKSSSSAASFNLGVFGTGSTVCTTTGDWQRVTHTFTAAETSRPFQILCNVNAEFLVWGAQVEAGSFPTSYIPTAGSAVTRAPDIATIEGTNFSSWYNQSEGTFYGQGSQLLGTSSPRVFVAASGSTTRTVDVFREISTGDISLKSETTLLTSYNDYTEPYLLTAAYKADDYAGSLNGVLAFTGVAGSVPTCDRLVIGNYYTASRYTNGHITRLAYFPTRKTDQELIDLTT